MCSFRDLTEKRRAEDSLHRLALEWDDRVRQRTAALLSFNDELESFAYAVSHDITGPLRTLVDYSQVLENRLGASRAA